MKSTSFKISICAWTSMVFSGCMVFLVFCHFIFVARISSMGSNWIKGIPKTQSIFNFHCKKWYLNWCWIFWMNLWKNISNVSWIFLNGFEMNLMSMGYSFFWYYKYNNWFSLSKGLIKDSKWFENDILMRNFLCTLFI
jgi:hypothetical protein